MSGFGVTSSLPQQSTATSVATATSVGAGKDRPAGKATSVGARKARPVGNETTEGAQKQCTGRNISAKRLTKGRFQSILFPLQNPN
ncbi:unnamed protein product [Adineta steineri]|uniref:Uncharacterized protein n=1 Tax=Adineta steineri TaxID=433720 RepID=A0A815AQR1_9BILA|nr:unnamed protein product [Adineta steineri]CAF1549279.1 unnamed protein product [Adineta steineri]